MGSSRTVVDTETASSTKISGLGLGLKPDLSMGWVDPRVGLSKFLKDFNGLGWVVGRKNFQKFQNSLYIIVCNLYQTGGRFVNLQLGASSVLTVVMFL